MPHTWYDSEAIRTHHMVNESIKAANFDHVDYSITNLQNYQWWSNNDSCVRGDFHLIEMGFDYLRNEAMTKSQKAGLHVATIAELVNYAVNQPDIAGTIVAFDSVYEDRSCDEKSYYPFVPYILASNGQRELRRGSAIDYWEGRDKVLCVKIP